MQQLTSQALEQMIPQQTKTSIMIIGGAEDKVHGREILQTFVHRAGASNAHLANCWSSRAMCSIICPIKVPRSTRLRNPPRTPGEQ